MRAYTLGCLLLLLGCKDPEHFIPIDELCRQVAADTCEARGVCCPGGDPEACLAAEEAACTPRLDPYLQDLALQYDSAYAERQSAANRAVLAMCMAAPLATFFKGGAALGTACERDTQCASGSCLGEPRTCTQPAPVALCPPPAVP